MKGRRPGRRWRDFILKLTRANTVAANSFFKEIGGYRFGEANHCSLGSAVDTPVRHTCGNTDVTRTDSRPDGKQLSEIRGLWQTRPFFSDWASFSFSTIIHLVWGKKAFTFYAWRNRSHVNYISWLPFQHLEWEIYIKYCRWEFGK